MKKFRFPGSAVFGLILIAVGVISLLSGLEYFESWDIFSTFWPTIIILLGVKSLLDYRSSTTWGLILIAVGSLLQLDQLDIELFGTLEIKEMIIPVLIILIGLNFIIPRRKEKLDKTTVNVRVDSRYTEEEVEAKLEAAEKTVEAEVEKVESSLDTLIGRVDAKVEEAVEIVEAKVSDVMNKKEEPVEVVEEVEEEMASQDDGLVEDKEA